MSRVSVMMVRRLPEFFYVDKDGKKLDNPVTVESLADELRVLAYVQLTAAFGLIDPLSVKQKGVSTEAVLIRDHTSQQSLWQTNCYAVIYEAEAYGEANEGFEHVFPVGSSTDPWAREWDKVFVPGELGATRA